MAVLTAAALTHAKTVSVGGIGDDWTTAPADDSAVAAHDRPVAPKTAPNGRSGDVWLPILLAAAAAITAVSQCGPAAVPRQAKKGNTITMTTATMKPRDRRDQCLVTSC